VVNYTVQDSNGSTASSTLTLRLTDSSEPVASNDTATATLVPVTVPGSPTTVTLADFSSTSNSANSGNGYNPWVYDTSGTGISVVDLGNGDRTSAQLLTDAATNTNKWLVSTNGSNDALDASVDNSGVLILRDNNGSGNNGAAQLFTPVYTTGATAGEKLHFDVTGRTNSGSSDVSTWTIYKYDGSAWVALSGVGYTGTIGSTTTAVDTGALEANTQYRIFLSVRDGDSNSGDLRINLDTFQAIIPGVDTVSWTAQAATGNVLSNDTLGSEGATLSVQSGGNWVAATAAGVPITGAYGSLVIKSDGSYTYTPTVETNNIGKNDVFQYQIKQADGDTSNASLTVHIGGVRYEGTGTTADTFTGAHNSLDLLVGGLGNDTLTGGTGTDVFKWGGGESGADTITDFKFGSVANGGDVLDLRDLLTGESSTGASLDAYLTFGESGGKLVMSIDSNGATAGGSEQSITFNNVASVAALRTELGLAAGASEVEIINKLLNNGNLKTD
jgi:VCBS repeat-containing protein